MGGELTAESEPGRGSTFRFQITLVVVDAERPSRRARAGLPEDTRVLVVDDNATNREIVRAYLRSRVAVCDDAESGPAALMMLEVAARDGRPYDLVLLDSEMPEMSGADVARAIRSEPLLQASRLVMLTSAGTGRRRGGCGAVADQAGPPRRAARDARGRARGHRAAPSRRPRSSRRRSRRAGSSSSPRTTRSTSS